MFAQQTRQPRFSGSRLTGDEHGAAAYSQADRRAVVLAAEEQSTTTHLRCRQTGLLRDPTDVVGDGCRARSVDHFVRDRTQGRAAPRDRHTDFAGIEHVVIVFGVADADGVVDGDPQRGERLPQPASISPLPAAAPSAGPG